MTHSSHARRRDVIEARNYEVALSRMIAEQKQRVMLVTLSGDWDLMKAEFEICQKLEEHRRELLDNGTSGNDSDIYLIRTLVQGRIPACTCRPDEFRPGEYCGDCGTYRADGDEF